MPIPQEDSTVNMTLDERVTPNTSKPVTSFNIHQPVVPGHDMVVNHVDGSQELAQGDVARQIAVSEATNGGVVVPVSKVKVPVEPPHRSVADPEVNQPSQVK